jgi:hypothetical protein
MGNSHRSKNAAAGFANDGSKGGAAILARRAGQRIRHTDVCGSLRTVSEN